MFIKDVYYASEDELERLFPSDPVISISSSLSPVLRNDRAFSILRRDMKKALLGGVMPRSITTTCLCCRVP